jgi:hypothetical protein
MLPAVATAKIVLEKLPDIARPITNQGSQLYERDSSIHEPVAAQASDAPSGNPGTFVFVNHRFERREGVAQKFARL